MTAIAIIAGFFAFILCCGLLSFLMMFQDVAPSQNSYWWPVLVPTGFVGLLVAGVIQSPPREEQAVNNIRAFAVYASNKLPKHVVEDLLIVHRLAEAAINALPSNATTNASLVEALEEAADAMTCGDDDSAHYCPNCDNSSFNARAKIRDLLATLRASNGDTK